MHSKTKFEEYLEVRGNELDAFDLEVSPGVGKTPTVIACDVVLQHNVHKTAASTRSTHPRASLVVSCSPMRMTSRLGGGASGRFRHHGAGSLRFFCSQ